MSDLSFFDPPIEIAAGSPRHDDIAARLKASGMRPYPASDPIDFSASDPLVIDIATVSRTVLEGLSRAAMVQVHRQVVLIDLSGAPVPTGSEAIILRRDRDLAALKSRLTALARSASRLREADIRRDTAAALGVRIPAADLNTVPSLLYIGEGSPLFLSLQGPLRQRGIEVAAAISRDTARQYMLEHRFAAALVDLDSFRSEDSPTTRWIAQENGLGALPIIALSRQDTDLTPHQNTVIGLATEVVDIDGPPHSLAARLEAVSRRLVAFSPIMPRPVMAAPLTDFTTGLFNRDFLESHVSRQMTVSTQRAEPLCMLTFRLDAALAVSLEMQRTFAFIIRSQIRDTDCPALMQPGLFAITLPSTPYRGAMSLAERIAARAIRHPAFANAGFGWRVLERRAYHTAQTLLDAGTSGPMIRPQIAA